MTGPTRRETLYAGGVLGCPILSGCVGSETDPDSTGQTEAATDDDEPNGRSNDDAKSNADTRMSEVETEVQQVEEALSGPAWDYENAAGFCTLFQKSADHQALFRTASESTQTFIDETDFETAVLLYVESVGPTSCFDELEFANLEVDTDESVLVGNATAVDTSARDVACKDVLTYPAAILRVTATPRPKTAAIRVSDGMGRTEIVRSRDEGTLTDESR